MRTLAACLIVASLVQTTASFAADAPQVVSLRDDGTVQHWDVKTGALIATLMPFRNNEWVILTPEGFFDTSSPKAAAIPAAH